MVSQQIKPNLTITPRAQEALKQAIKETPYDDLVVRLIGKGGCGALAFDLALDRSTHESDIVLEFDGFTFVMDPTTEFFAQGITIDLSEEQTGFEIRDVNPSFLENSCSTCAYNASEDEACETTNLIF